MKRSIKKKVARRKPVYYDYQSINKKLARVSNIIGIIHITFRYK
jgi:hypothetical protein